MLKLAQDYQPALFSQSVTDYVEHGKEFANLNISGLGCKTNMSLTFIAMDSLMQRDLAERLGIDISNRKDKTVAVIVNEKVVAVLLRYTIYCVVFSARSASHYGRPGGRFHPTSIRL